MQPQVKKNLILLWIRTVCINASLALTSGSVLSGFFIKFGMSEGGVSAFLAMQQAVNLVVSMLFCNACSRHKNTRAWHSAFCLMYGVSTCIFVIFCFVRLSLTGFGAVAMAVGALMSTATAMRLIFEYKIPCEVIEVSHYSFYSSMGGIFSGCAGLGVGFAMTACYKAYDFYLVTAGIFAATLVLMIAAFICNACLTVLFSVPEEPKKSHGIGILSTLWHYDDFRILLAPNIIRGIGAAAFNMIAVLVSTQYGLDNESGSLITTLTYVSTFGSCLIYNYLGRRFGLGRLCFWGGILTAVLSVAFVGDITLFYVIYTLSYFGYNIVSYAIPDLIYRHVDANIISAFHTWRMVGTTVTTAAFTAIFGALVKIIPMTALVIIASASILYCSWAYFRFYRTQKAK